METEDQEAPEVAPVCRACKACQVFQDRKENGVGEVLEANRD